MNSVCSLLCTSTRQGNPVATAVPMAPIQGVAIEGQRPFVAASAHVAAVGSDANNGAPVRIAPGELPVATATAIPAATAAASTAAVAPI